MCRDFYIFRHGQSTYNVLKRTQGQTNDSVLTELGRAQALAVGRKLQNRHIEIIVTSPLMRAVQTAETANEALHVDIVEDEHFLEVNVGEAEGLHYTEVLKRYKDVFEKLHSADCDKYQDICYPNGETKREVKERIFEGLEKWCAKPYHTIAVSTHGIALSQIMYALGKEAKNIENGTIIHIQKDEKTWKLIETIQIF